MISVFENHSYCAGILMMLLDAFASLLPYSLNISRGKFFADFAVLGVISENFTLEIFRPPYSLIHFGSVCKSMKILFLTTLFNLEIIAPRNI